MDVLTVTKKKRHVDDSYLFQSLYCCSRRENKSSYLNSSVNKTFLKISHSKIKTAKSQCQKMN